MNEFTFSNSYWEKYKLWVYLIITTKSRNWLFFFFSELQYKLALARKKVRIARDSNLQFQLNFNLLSLAIRFTCSAEQNWGCLSIPWAAAPGEFGSFGSCQFLFFTNFLNAFWGLFCLLQSELSPPMLIEHPLRCLVLCAQVHAGMWRRNGFSLVNQARSLYICFILMFMAFYFNNVIAFSLKISHFFNCLCRSIIITTWSVEWRCLIKTSSCFRSVVSRYFWSLTNNALL